MRFQTPFGFQLELQPCYFVERHILLDGGFDLAIQRYFELFVQPGWVCFDVGANIGLMTTHLANRVGQVGHVYAFEPVGRLRERVQLNLELNGLAERASLESVALSDSAGRCTFHVPLPAEVNQGVGSVIRDDRYSTEPLEVETETLDGFVERTGLKRLDLIKLDVQGAEPMVLRGAESALRKYRPVIVLEVEPPLLKEVGCDAKKLFSQIEALDYDLFERGDNDQVGQALFAETVDPSYQSGAVLARPRQGAVTSAPAKAG